MINDIYVIGYPKTGTTWLCRLLGDYLDSPVGSVYRPSSTGSIATEGQHRTGKYYIGHGHSVPVHNGTDKPLFENFVYINIDALTDERIVLMGRDPRDVAISAMYHWKMTLEQTIDCMLYGHWPISHGKGWNNFYDAWNDGWDPRITTLIPTSYEDLLGQTSWVLSNILKRFDLPVDNKRLHEVVYRQSFLVRKKWTGRWGTL